MPCVSHDLIHAQPDDAAALAALHVATWRKAYAQMAPAKALQLLDETRRLPYWQQALTDQNATNGTLVARSARQIDGLVRFAPATNPALGAAIEVKHLYVRDSAQGQGLGKRLLMAAFDQLREAGQQDIALAVVRENQAARAFYRRMAGFEDGSFLDPGPLWRSENIIVRWVLPA